MSKKRLMIFSLAGLTMFSTVFSTSAFAADNGGETIETPLSSLYKCAKIIDGSERLACFDSSVAKLHTAEQNKEVVAIDAKAAKKIKREAFGFNLPSLSKIGLPSIGLPKIVGGTDVESLVVDVKSVRKSGRGYVITMENGQIWKEVGGRLNYIPKGDLKATIKPKCMGSFMLSLNNGKTTVRGLRVRRVE